MFPGSTGEVEGASYVVVGAPLDNTTTFYPGARFGPERIRHYAGHFDDYDRATDARFSDLDVADAGDVGAWDDTEDYLEYLRSTLSGVVLDGAIPLILGGEHTVSLAGVRATEPRTYVAIDAHLDLREEYDGNPLNHATTSRRILEHVDRAVIIGARTGSKEEWDRADADDVEVLATADLDRWQPGDDSIYLSVDIDGVDPAYAPGTGTPEPFGLDPSTVATVIDRLAPAVVGFDIVEVNDRDHGEAATLAAKFVRRFVYAHADRS